MEYFELSYSGRRTRTIKEMVFQKLGSKCAHCGITDKRVFQIDHIDGGGSKERRIPGNSGIAFYVKVLKDETNKFQILCANCNQIKTVEKRERTGQPLRPKKIRQMLDDLYLML